MPQMAHSQRTESDACSLETEPCPAIARPVQSTLELPVYARRDDVTSRAERFRRPFAPPPLRDASIFTLRRAQGARVASFLNICSYVAAAAPLASAHSPSLASLAVAIRARRGTYTHAALSPLRRKHAIDASAPARTHLDLRLHGLSGSPPGCHSLRPHDACFLLHCTSCAHSPPTLFC